MIPVTDYDALAPLLNELLFSGAMTNTLPSRSALEREIRAGTLFSQTVPGGLLLLRRRPDHDRLSILLERGELGGWRPEGPAVVELPHRIGDRGLDPAREAFSALGFALCLTRVRLSRRGAAVPADGGAEPGCAYDEALALFRRCFDPMTGCLPTREELEEASLLTLPGAALHYAVKGGQTELRHLAVCPERRGQGLARQLMACYLAREGHRLSRVWTGRDNEAALRLYHAFGYREDPWQSEIYLYQP